MLRPRDNFPYRWVIAHRGEWSCSLPLRVLNSAHAEASHTRVTRILPSPSRDDWGSNVPGQQRSRTAMHAQNY